ncbi:gamma carbonic anhydrase family protein [Desulfosarcina ovata]|uniref:Transferase, hexapeptide repeat family protein n=2 Tax=Desulfosarcina ovata TaxID=83564 RepID=A0A5K8AF34_9BACT|nr:gamma carbonic anhydrase family protein [Desulfosarcina ovata]BBO84753.1 transferase, hexapeptide repeat family protein [Desulfosarcina ovata subsp. sediminis]BBO91255.1 transferase, hexapeptide repeat family protein [Desulfosarcina ovata subsp. ovata]
MLYQFDGRRPQIGKTTYISELAQIIGDVVIGENCYIGHGAILRGDYGRIVIGNETAVEEGVIIHAPPDDTQTIGRRVTMGHGAILHAKSIGDLAVIGMGAIVSLFSQVGEGSIVAEGSVVKSNQAIPDNVVAAGNPARVVRPINDRDEAMWTYGKQLYVDLAAKYLSLGMTPVSR